MPKFKVKWLKLALDDIDNIAEYISKDDPLAARSVVRKIWIASQSLSEFPTRARLGRVANTRELVLAYLPYIIVFRIKSNVVEIIRVIHTARNYC